MKVKIAICDDDRKVVWELAQWVGKQAPQAETTTFTDAEMLLSSPLAFDIVLLDIQMKGLDGLEAARQLHTRYPFADDEPHIIFVSGHDHFMPNAFDVGAFHYLVKPVSEDRFAEVFGKALGLVRYKHKPAKSIILKTEDLAGRRIDLRRIEYVESANKKVVVQTLDGPVICIDQINRLATELGKRFFRSHRGYLVNLDMVVGYTRDTIQLASGATVLMARKNFALLPEAILRHEMENEEGQT